MKNLFLSLVFILIGSFAFSNNIDNNLELRVEKTSKVKTEVDILLHNCQYGVYNSRGERIGTVIVTDVPDNVSCSSSSAKAKALAIWNAAN